MLKSDSVVLENTDFSPDPCILLRFDFFMVYYIFVIFFILCLFKDQKIQEKKICTLLSLQQYGRSTSLKPVTGMLICQSLTLREAFAS